MYQMTDPLAALESARPSNRICPAEAAMTALRDTHGDEVADGYEAAILSGHVSQPEIARLLTEWTPWDVTAKAVANHKGKMRNR